jgi:hypothetical protein
MRTLPFARSSLRAFVVAAICFLLFACVDSKDAETQVKAELELADQTLSKPDERQRRRL